MQDPDYNYMKNLFRNLMKKHDYIYDFNFDWTRSQNDKRLKGKDSNKNP